MRGESTVKDIKSKCARK